MAASKRSWTGITAAVLVGAAMASPAHAALKQVAHDNAANYTTWGTAGLNEGVGLDEWVFQTSGGGHFLADGNQQVDNIATSDKAWGMWANDGGGAGIQHVAAFRGFGWDGSGWQNALSRSGDEFRISFEHGDIDTDSSCGFTLRNGNSDSDPSKYNDNARFEFGWFRGDGARNPNYTIYDNSINPIDTGIPYRFTGLDIIFKMTGPDTYEVNIYDSTNALTTLASITGTLNNSGKIESVALYDRDTDTDGGNDVFFNKIEIHHFTPPTILIVE